MSKWGSALWEAKQMLLPKLMSAKILLFLFTTLYQWLALRLAPQMLQNKYVVECITFSKSNTKFLHVPGTTQGIFTYLV